MEAMEREGREGPAEPAGGGVSVQDTEDCDASAFTWDWVSLLSAFGAKDSDTSTQRAPGRCLWPSGGRWPGCRIGSRLGYGWAVPCGRAALGSPGSALASGLLVLQSRFPLDRAGLRGLQTPRVFSLLISDGAWGGVGLLGGGGGGGADSPSLGETCSVLSLPGGQRPRAERKAPVAFFHGRNFYQNHKQKNKTKQTHTHTHIGG